MPLRLRGNKTPQSRLNLAPFRTENDSQEIAAISSEFKFRHNVNTLVLPNSLAVRPEYR